MPLAFAADCHTLRAPYSPRPIGRSPCTRRISHHHLRVAHGPRRGRPGLGRVVASTGRSRTPCSRSTAADRLDPEPFLVHVDERDSPRQSRVELPREETRRRQQDLVGPLELLDLLLQAALISAASLVVVPGRRPASISACLHQPRNVSGFTPTRGPIRTTAAFNDSSGSCSRASTHEPHRPLPQLVRILPRCWHPPTLPWDQSLHQTRGASQCDHQPIPAAAAGRGEARWWEDWG